MYDPNTDTAVYSLMNTSAKGDVRFSRVGADGRAGAEPRDSSPCPLGGNAGCGMGSLLLRGPAALSAAAGEFRTVINETSDPRIFCLFKESRTW